MHYRRLPHGRSRDRSSPQKAKLSPLRKERPSRPKEGMPTHYSIEEALRLPKEDAKSTGSSPRQLLTTKKCKKARTKARSFGHMKACHVLCRLVTQSTSRTRICCWDQSLTTVISSSRVRKGAQGQPHARGWWLSHKHHAKINNDRNRHQSG